MIEVVSLAGSSILELTLNQHTQFTHKIFRGSGENGDNKGEEAISSANDESFTLEMRSLLSEEFRWKGKLKGVKEGVAALQSSKNKVAFDSLKTTAQALHFAKTSLTSELDWKFAQIMFGITTSYRRESDGTLSVKLEGELNDVPLFEQVRIRQSTFFGGELLPCV